MATSLKKKQSSKSKSAKKSFPKKAKRGGKKTPAKRTIKKTATVKKAVKKPVKKSSPASKKTVKKPVKVKKKMVKKTAKKPVKSLKKTKLKKSTPKKRILEKKPVKKIKKASAKKIAVKKAKKAVPAKKKQVKKVLKKAIRKPVKKKAPTPKKPSKPAVKKVPVSKPAAPITVPKPAAAPKPEPAVTPQPAPVVQQPQAPATPKLSTEIQGVALIEAVIDKIRKENLTRFGGYSMNGPRPLSEGQIASLTFPGGKPLSPSIKRWLQFDASWLEELGWLEITGSDVSFTVKSISEFAAKEYGDDMKEFFEPFDRVFPGRMYFLPLGSDSRRALYVGTPDQTGEYPVLYTDIDDGAAIGLMYPGFDVYMADLVGLFELKFGTYTDLCNHPSFSVRMKAHSDNNLRGRADVDSFDAEEMLGQ